MREAQLTESLMVDVFVVPGPSRNRLVGVHRLEMLLFSSKVTVGSVSMSIMNTMSEVFCEAKGSATLQTISVYEKVVVTKVVAWAKYCMRT